jgi:hypothetical protein
MQVLNIKSEIAQTIVQAYALELHNVKFETDSDSIIIVQGNRPLGHIYKRDNQFFINGDRFDTLYHATTSVLGRSEVNRIYKVAQAHIKQTIS